jgi:hypothetical protein
MERIRPIIDDKFMATTLTAIITILEPIRTSAQVLIRSFLGVKAFRKYPQDATAQPDTYPPTINPIVHSIDGAKKNGIVAIRHTPILARIVYFAAIEDFTK